MFTFRIFALIFIFFNISNIYAFNITYIIPLKQTKNIQIQKALKLAQYKYDLNKFDEILKILNQSESFKTATDTAETYIKNDDSFSTNEYIEALLEILNGVNCEDNKNEIGGGYIKYVKDLDYQYNIYLKNYPTNSVINKSFDVIEDRIKNSLIKLNENFKKEENIKINLKTIMQNLIISLKEIEVETEDLKKLGIIKPFTSYMDKKYCILKNWAQIDGKTTLWDIINFILNGDIVNKNGKKLRLYGIIDYYNKFYNNDLKPFIITQ